jgi:alpha-tubulin suppressor-like RCC1 family protein
MANININAGDVSQRALRNSDKFHKQADHRYVNFSDGDDANNGSMYRPWQSLAHAIANTASGHNLYYAGGEGPANFALSGASGIAVIGEKYSQFTGSITLTNCSDIMLDIDIIGALTLNQCADIRIKQGSNIASITCNNHNGLLELTNNIDCNVNIGGVGTGLEVYVHENQGGVGVIQFSSGATGDIIVKNSECDFIQAIGAGVLNLRLENSFAPSGIITPVSAGFNLDRWADSDIDNTDPDGTNAFHFPTTAAVVDYVAEQTATTPETIEHIYPSGLNMLLVQTTEGVYSAAGNNTVSTSYTGRGAAGNPQYWGTTNLQKIAFIGKEGVGVRSCHTNYSCTLVLFDDDELWGWGNNLSGQLGLGDATAREFPVLLKTGVSEILTNEDASGYSHSVATQFIKATDGWIWAAGGNAQGQMGLGDSAVRNTWTRLDWIGQNPLAVKPVGTTYGFLFVQKSDQTLWATGYNGHGQFGDGTTTSVTTAIDVSDDWFGVGNTFPIFDIVGGAGWFTTSAQTQSFAIVVYDNVGTKVSQGAGNNTWGALATGALGGTFNTPQSMALGDIVQISAIGGGPAACSVVRSDGSFWTWGRNAEGQAGDGTTTDRSTLFNALNGIAEILRPQFSANTYSFSSTVFLRDTSGYAWVSGFNTYGQAGVGNLTTVTTYERVRIPKPVKAVGQLATGGDGRGISTIFATDDNELWTCGYNAHNGVHMVNTIDVTSPVRVLYK